MEPHKKLTKDPLTPTLLNKTITYLNLGLSNNSGLRLESGVELVDNSDDNEGGKEDILSTTAATGIIPRLSRFLSIS